jgi:uncharacterized protein YjiK
MKKIIVIACTLSILSMDTQETSSLYQFNINDESAHLLKLKKELKEISGITFSKDGKLFCHNDEKGIIYQIDINNGKIIKKFKIGILTVNKDFEDITVVGDTFYLVTSSGDLYNFKEGKKNASVKYEVVSTGLTKRNNVEGLCYDPETNCLLLACKGYAGKGYKKYKAVYAYSLSKNKLLIKPRFLIPSDETEKFSKENKFEPSGIARHPETGHFFIIAAGGNLIVEISKTGQIIAQKRLKKKLHAQPEGIVFKSANELLISDEGQAGSARITFYNTILDRN